MKSTLDEILKEKLLESGISVNALEKQAGLKRSAVQNILHGKSKKPSAEILYAISKVLGCSLNELLGSNKNSEVSQRMSSIATMKERSEPINMENYLKAVKAAAKIFKQHQFYPNQSVATNFISEIYHYAVKSDKPDIDPIFVEWLFEKVFPNKS